MIDLSSDTPTTEDFLNGVQRCVSQINESVQDLQYLCKQNAEGNLYLTDEETAKMLHCEKEELPNIRRTRGAWSRGYLYKMSDITAWLEGHAAGGKK